MAAVEDRPIYGAIIGHGVLIPDQYVVIPEGIYLQPFSSLGKTAKVGEKGHVTPEVLKILADPVKRQTSWGNLNLKLPEKERSHIYNPGDIIYDMIIHFKATWEEKCFGKIVTQYIPSGIFTDQSTIDEIKICDGPDERIKNDSTYWLIFELLWRDFFRFTAQKQGNQLFRSNGLQPQKKIKWKTDHDLFLSWSNGETGIPFIDANMKELNATGFMSNRGRQNVASYLTKHLGLDWRMGAEYFESLLIDYDVCSNYGNWAYIAGVGNDPIDRIFNPHKQADQYDSKGKYVEYWLGESIVEKQTSLFD